MAFDVIFARALAAELDGALFGGRVEKVYQPTREELVLVCHTGRETKRLVLSASPSSARAGITERIGENPAAPPMLCMLLRKHLTGAVFGHISTLGFDRVLVFPFDCRDELGFPCRKYLIAEVMGNYSNVIFTSESDGKMKILGVMRTVDFESSRVRQVMPGMTYTPPPSQMKHDPFSETEDGFAEKYFAYPAEKGAEKFFVETYTGFAPTVARELVFRAGGNRVGRLWEEFSSLLADVREGRFEPYIVLADDGTAVDFSFTEIKYIGKSVKMPSFSELLDEFYGKKADELALKNRIGATESVVVSARKRLVRKVTVLEDELAECRDMDKYRLWGDLLTASLYKLSGKAREVTVENYYSPDFEKVTVPLDERLSPSQNAAKYYKKYSKLKTEKTAATEQLEKARGELEYLASVTASLSMCENAADAAEIREELIRSGYVKPQGGAPRKSAKSVPLHFVTSGGRDIYCGKNNLQNDMLTLKTADGSDFWFHVKGGAGSHVIMKCLPDEDPDARDFTEAAQLAAFYSDAKSSDNVPVDYTRARFVKKPSGAAPGHVIYTDYYTAYVKPSAELERKND